jgi:hypothetical protein
MPGSDKTEQLLAIKELELSVSTADNGGASIKPIIQMLRDSISLYDGPTLKKEKSIMIVQQPDISHKLGNHEIERDTDSNYGREKGVVDEQPTYIDPTIQDAVAGRTRSRSRHLVNATAVNPITGKPLKYKDLRNVPDALLWNVAKHGEFVRLIEVSKTMRPIKPKDKPAGRFSFSKPSKTP